MQTETKEDRRFDNNYDFLRFVAALMVVFFHSYALLRIGKSEPLYIFTGFMDFGVLGVVIFFVISGYLITQSWRNNPSLLKFYWNRILRIVPGLVCLALFTVFIIGPLVSNKSIVDYFSNGITWSYFRIITVLGILPQTPLLPGVFINNPYPNAVNGSLWTLPAEFVMYMLISAFGVLGLLYRKKLMLVITIGISVIYLFCNINELADFQYITQFGLYQKMFALINLNGHIFIYPIFFLIGSLYNLYGKSIKYDVKLIGIMALIWILSFKTAMFYPASMVCLPYIILGIANLRIPHLNQITKYGDFSYGLYIYAFVIQQTIIYFIKDISMPALFVTSLLASLAFAVLSWKYVEAKALKLKSVNPVSIVKSIINKVDNII